MSLRYASRLVLQGGARAKEAASRSIKDAATSASANSGASASSSASRQQARRVVKALDHKGLKAAVAEEKRRKAEESLRTVMYLSCWGPN